jgi:hypothetical protein
MGYVKKSQEIAKDLKPAGETFKDPGQVEKVQYNPKPNAFAVTPKVQQETDKAGAAAYMTEGASIPAAAIKPVKAILNWFKKSADDVTSGGKAKDPGSSDYKDPGQKEKLQYPTKVDEVSVKQPGLEKSEDAGSKTYKDPGQKEKLGTPQKVDMPKVDTVVDVDNKIGNQFKDEGEKEKLNINPKQDTVSTSQEKVKIDIPSAGEEKATGMQKQFGQINWMKKNSAATPEAQEYVSKKIATNIEEGKPQEQAVAIGMSQAREKGYDVPEKRAEMLAVITRFAAECPECFHNLVLQVASGMDVIGTVRQAMTKAEADAKVAELGAANPDKAYVTSPVEGSTTEYTVTEAKKAALEDDILLEQERAMEEQLLKNLQSPEVQPAAQPETPAAIQ